MPKYTVKIDNEYLPDCVKIKAGSLTINEGQPGNPTVCDFELVDKNLEGAPFIWGTMKGTKVQIYEDGILKFGGQIDVPQTWKINNHPIYGEKIVCIDWMGILQHRTINKSYPRSLISDIAKDFIDSFLYNDGFWYDSLSIPDTTLKYASINYNYTFADKAFAELAGLINWLFWIGPDKKVYFREQSLNTSTIQLIENETNYLPRSLVVEEDPSEYRTKQILRDVNALTDLITEKASPTPDKDRAYRVSFPLNQKPEIYLSLLENIDDPLETERVDPGEVGISGLDTGLTFYWNKDSTEILHDKDADEIPNLHYLVVKYVGKYKIDIIEQDDTAVTSRSLIEGGSGLYENVEKASNIEGISIAESLAEAYLDKYSGNIPLKIGFASYTMDIPNGYFMDVILPSFNIESRISAGGGFLVMDKRYMDNGAGLFLKTYVLVDGAPIGGWIDYVKRQSAGEKDFEVRPDALVSVPILSQETIDFSGQVTIKTFDCLYPSNTLYPNNSLYPGTLTSTVIEYD